MNSRDLTKSRTIAPINHKIFNNMNLNKLGLSLTNSVEKSNYIVLKDGQIKEKRKKNSYFEESVDTKRLLRAMGAEAKIRKVKSWVDDITKKNLFFKADFHNISNIKNKRNSDNTFLGKFQRKNLHENVIIDFEEDDEEDNNSSIILNHNHIEENNHNHKAHNSNKSLSCFHNEIMKSLGDKHHKSEVCNCNKYDNKSVCKFKHKHKTINNNKNQDYAEKRNMYIDLHKRLNNSKKKQELKQLLKIGIITELIILLLKKEIILLKAVLMNPFL